MSVYATMYVWENSKQKSTSLLALLAIADYADEITGEAFPGIAALAKKLRMKERNTQTLLRILEDSGELSIALGKGQHTATGNTNRYTLVGYADWVKEVQKIAPRHNQGVQKSVSRGAKKRREGVQEVAPKPSLEPSEPSVEQNAPIMTLNEKTKMADGLIQSWADAQKWMGTFNTNYRRMDAFKLIDAGATPEEISTLVKEKLPGRKTAYSFKYLVDDYPEWKAIQISKRPKPAKGLDAFSQYRLDMMNEEKARKVQEAS